MYRDKCGGGGLWFSVPFILLDLPFGLVVPKSLGSFSQGKETQSNKRSSRKVLSDKIWWRLKEVKSSNEKEACQASRPGAKEKEKERLA